MVDGPVTPVTEEGPLTQALEAALVRELLACWRQVNESLFQERLRAPTLELTDSRARLGQWVSETRTLEISRPLVLEQPWAAVLEVLKHEVAHQYVDEVLGEHEQTAHGPAFRDTCARLGIDARAVGLPRPGPGDGEERIIERVARLLALAESPNRHEAEAAMAAAQRLMLKHNLDNLSARQPLAYRHAHLGRPSGRVGEHERLVAMILGRHFFVEVIWIPAYRPLDGKRGSVLEICGTPANLAIAEYVHGFLHQTAERLWDAHKKEHAIDSDRERRTYLAGVMVGFADRLTKQDVRARSEGLVWVKDADLSSYFRTRHPHVRHVRHAGRRRTAAWEEGREAGRAIVLCRPVHAAPTSRGKLLPGRS